MEYDVRLEQVGSHPLAVVRRRASSMELSRVVPDACGLVWNAVKKRNLTGVGRNIALYWDCEINLEVGVELESPLAEDDEVVGSATPAGSVVTATHFGPYNGLHAAHKAIHDYCKDRGCALAGPSWEIYGHWTDECNADPSKICTDIYYLLID